MKNNFFAFIGAVIAISVYILSLLFNLDLFEALLETIEKLEHLEFDEFIIPVFIFLLFFTLNQRKKNRISIISLEKEKVFRATLSSSKHIINNFLNQMTLFKMTADETPQFPKDILNLYDEVINESQKQLESLSNVNDLRETAILYSVSPNKFHKAKL